MTGVDLTRMHGRGQLGAPQELTASSGATVFAADDSWVFALGSGSTQQAPLTGGVPGAWANVGALPAAATTAATFQGRLYAVAGTAVESAEISATGLGAWRSEAPLASAGVCHRRRLQRALRDRRHERLHRPHELVRRPAAAGRRAARRRRAQSPVRNRRPQRRHLRLGHQLHRWLARRLAPRRFARRPSR